MSFYEQRKKIAGSEWLVNCVEEWCDQLESGPYQKVRPGDTFMSPWCALAIRPLRCWLFRGLHHFPKPSLF